MPFTSGMTGLLLGLAAVAVSACSGRVDANNPAQPGSASPSNPGTPATPGSPASPGNVPSMTPVARPAPMVPPGALPPSTCGGEVPGSFLANCSGCHTRNGAANGRYPDLFAFKGTIADFKAKVRAGGTGMAAYPDSIISDADLAGDVRLLHRHEARRPRQRRPRQRRPAVQGGRRRQSAHRLQARRRRAGHARRRARPRPPRGSAEHQPAVPRVGGQLLPVPDLRVDRRGLHRRRTESDPRHLAADRDADQWHQLPRLEELQQRRRLRDQRAA